VKGNLLVIETETIMPHFTNFNALSYHSEGCYKQNKQEDAKENSLADQEEFLVLH